MNCRNCGKYYPDDEKRCPWCNCDGNPMERPGKMVAESSELLSVKYNRSMLRGVVGYALFGALGGFVGLRAKKTARFRVTYKSGHTGVETVKVGSKRFRELDALRVE